MQRTNIIIDEKLMESCLHVTGIKTRRALVDHALRELLRREEQAKINAKILKKRLAACLILLLALSAWSQAGSSPGTPDRTLHGRLAGIDDRPSSGVTVLLLCVTPNHAVNAIQAARNQRYHVRTRADGSFEFKLGQFESPITDYESWEKEDSFPGWGVYHLYVPADAHAAGALSQPIVNLAGMRGADFYQQKLVNPVRLEDLRGPIRLRMKSGRAINGAIRAPAGEPLADQPITADLLLPDGTPNPRFVQVRLGETRSNADGQFAFKNLYPGTVLLDTGKAPPYWTQTQTGAAGKWVPDRIDAPDLSGTTGTLNVRIMASRTEDFSISGHVRDSEGKAIEGAQIEVYPASRSQAGLTNLAGNYKRTTTDASGRYALKLGYPWLGRITVTRAGYEAIKIYADGKVMQAGPRDFELQRPATLTLAGRVLDPEGKPAAHVPVYLLNMARGGLTNLKEAAKLPNYHTVTDAEGRFKFLLGKYRGDFSEKQQSDDLPPWGDYYVVVNPGQGHAGAISTRLLHDAKPEPKRYSIPAKALDPTPEPVELKLSKGIQISGHVILPDGAPLANAQVELSYDLHAMTHTGNGGEMWERRTRTDADGRFTFDKVYPAEFSLALTDQAWLKTRLAPGQTWTDRPKNYWPNLGAQPHDLALEIMVGGKERFRYYGRVTDEQGQPVANARAFFGETSLSERPSDFWGDNHHFPETNTDAQGQYEYLSPYPWLRFVGAEAPGYLQSMIDHDQDPTAMKPGRYDLKIQRKQLE